MEQEMEERIKCDLPVGTDFNHVESYLDNAKIEYSWHEKSSAFYGIIRNIKNNQLVSESIQLIIRMDHDKKLVSIELKNVMTGP